MNTNDALDRLPSRGRTYATFGGTIALLLSLGLILPFVIGNARTAGSDSVSVVDLGSPTDPAPSGEAPGTLSTVDPTDAPTDGTPGEPAPLVASPRADAGGTSGPGTSGEAPSTSGSAGTGGDTGGGAPPASNQATDVGVTPDSVKVAVFIPDLGSAEDLGFQINTGNQRLAFGTFFDEVNERGGVHGRTLDPVYITFDPLDQDDMRRACIQATEDEKVFAGFNDAGFYGAAILCMTEEHSTPYITATQHEPDEWYRRSKGLMLSYLTSKSRILVNFVEDLHALGLLEGRTIGVVDSEYPADKLASERSLLPTIERLGYEVTHRATIPEAADQAAARISVEIENMRSKGVDTILFAVNFLVQEVWVVQSDNRDYHPRYHTSDMGGGTTDGATSQMPASYEGTVGFTSLRTGEMRAGYPEPEKDARCREAYEQRTGDETPRGTAQYDAALSACQLIRDFASALQDLGPNLTRADVPRAYERFGTFEIVAAPFGSFAPGKYDAIDQVRTIVWRANCECWEVASDFRAFKP